MNIADTYNWYMRLSFNGEFWIILNVTPSHPLLLEYMT